MQDIKQCKSCGFRNLLIINELQESDDNHMKSLHLCASWSGHVRAGKVRAIVCCRCGWIDWRAYDLGHVLSMLGDLYPNVRLMNGELDAAVRALGLVPTEGAGFAGWQFYAEGSYADIALVVGERVQQRAADSRHRNVMRLEIRVKGRTHLGNCAIRHPNAVGLNPKAVYRKVVQTGDPEFDRLFTVVMLDPVEREIALMEARGGPAVVKIPWLDGNTRSKLAAAAPEEVFVLGEEVGVVLFEYNPQNFPAAIDLAVHLARWSGPSEHPYR